MSFGGKHAICEDFWPSTVYIMILSIQFYRNCSIIVVLTSKCCVLTCFSKTKLRKFQNACWSQPPWNSCRLSYGRKHSLSCHPMLHCCASGSTPLNIAPFKLFTWKALSFCTSCKFFLVIRELFFHHFYNCLNLQVYQPFHRFQASKYTLIILIILSLTPLCYWWPSSKIGKLVEVTYLCLGVCASVCACMHVSVPQCVSQCVHAPQCVHLSVCMHVCGCVRLGTQCGVWGAGCREWNGMVDE